MTDTHVPGKMSVTVAAVGGFFAERKKQLLATQLPCCC